MAIVEILLIFIIEVILVPSDQIRAPSRQGQRSRALTRLSHSPPPRTAGGQQNVLLLTFISL